MSDSRQVAFLDNENENRAALALSRLDAKNLCMINTILSIEQVNTTNSKLKVNVKCVDFGSIR